MKAPRREYSMDDAYQDAYDAALGNGNWSREARRTINGKLAVAKAEIAGLKAKLKFIEEKGGDQ